MIFKGALKATLIFALCDIGTSETKTGFTEGKTSEKEREL